MAAGRSFTYSDHADLDLPAAVDAVLAATGEAQLYWVGQVNLPYSLALEATSWIEAGELLNREGSPRLRPNPVPMLVLGASADQVVSEPDVRATCTRFPDCEYRLLGAAGGLSTEYGHIDVLLGRTAPTEVYPIIVDWLGQKAGR